MSAPQIIAIDGTAASGKSTLARRLADHLDYLYFDTGVMYRAVTWVALERGYAMGDEGAITELAKEIQIDVRSPSKNDGRSYDVWVNGDDITWEIRKSEVDTNVSRVSAYPGVREALSVQQRRIGSRGQVVMVGRDIGTVVLPEADLKIYLDASVEKRALRRFRELSERSEETSYEKIMEAMRRRDRIDSTREVAPLRPAEDAVYINSDEMDADQIFNRVKQILRADPPDSSG